MSNSTFIKATIEKAKLKLKRVVLSEGYDERVLKAAYLTNKDKIANIVILGKEDEIKEFFNKNNYDLNGIEIIDPETSELTKKYAKLFFELRRSKGISEEEALKTAKKYNYFATLMVKAGDADGHVAGAANSTADTVRPALQIIKSASKGASVSAFFAMVCGEDAYIFADLGLVEDPDETTLADIAIQSAKTAISLGIDPKVAMLSYSTNGSAKSHLVDKVQNATKLAKEKLELDENKDLGIELDGEMQLDAAIVPEIAARKFKDSKVAGKARVLIFPNLDSGNIGYKLVQRLGGAEAYGPVLQGLAAPVNDLSRGCSAEDIVGVIAITSLQAIYMENK